MKITETILAQLTDTDAILESVYQAIADVDPNYAEEIDAYELGVQALLQEVPDAEAYLQARRQELASDIRFAMWQGFMWNLDCHRNPVYKLMAQLDFEDLCQESKMHTLPAAQKAQATARAFTQSLPEDKQPSLDPIIDHFAYLETYGYKLAFRSGFTMADRLLGYDISSDKIEQLYNQLDNIIYEMHCAVGRAVGITCFSETHSNMLMWSHYANKHTGI